MERHEKCKTQCAVCCAMAALSLLIISGCTSTVNEPPSPKPMTQSTETPSPTPGADSEVWVDLETAYYENEELGIAIEFPARWAGHLALIEQHYPYTPAVIVCCREVAEAELETIGAPEYAIIFSVVSVNKDAAAGVREAYADPECFTFLQERDGVLYYYSNAHGKIKGAELWHKDLWETNKELLTEMAELYDEMIDKVQILD